MSNLELVTISDIVNIFSSGSYDDNTSASKLFDNNISTSWNSFANDANGNTYVTIELRESAILKSFKIKGISQISDGSNGLRDYRILGSNDNSIFDTLLSVSNPNTKGDTLLINVDNNKKYKFYKFEALNSWFSTLKRVAFAEIEYYVIYSIKMNLLKSNNKIYSLKSEEVLYGTKMTSNTTPAPFVASASSSYSTTYSAWKAFNGTTIDNADAWITADGAKAGWVQIDLGKRTKISKVLIKNRNHTVNPLDAVATSPKDFNILGSDDGVNFKLILGVTNESWLNNESKQYHLGNIYFYRYYRVEVLSNNGANYTAIGDILFSYIEALTEIPSSSINNFINYGTLSIEDFNLINTTKNYVLQDTVSEDTDGLWVQEIDRKPLSIKFE